MAQAGEAGLRRYYVARAREYEDIYFRDDPQRQLEQLELAAAVGRTCLNRRVLEVACGTGYWTQVADRVAEDVTAVDAASSVLDIARTKDLRRTQLQLGDAYDPPGRDGGYSAALALFWLSHVPRARRTDFLGSLHARLGAGARVLLADNQDVPGVGGERTEPDAAGDTHKLRRLADGSVHRILKNYFAPEELERLLSPYAADLSVHSGQRFWWATYTARREKT